MKYHHAAALALVGWYLMVPPFETPLWNRLTGKNVSISGWLTVNSYAQFDDCDLDRDRLLAHQLYIRTFGRWTLPESNVKNEATTELERQALQPLWAWSTTLDEKNRLIEATPYADRQRIFDQLGAAMCIATDDPRLKEK